MGELIMKTNRIITMLAVAAAAMACNQAEIESPSALKANQFMASAPSTKVSMNADFSLYWEAGDQVSVFAPDGSNNLFTSEAETGAKTTVLNGADSFTIDLSQTYYAIYPYSADNSIENGVITTTIPTVQTPVKGAFPVNHAVAVSDRQNLSFMNVCGLFGFNITQEDIVSVTIKAKGAQEYLTGKVAVDCAAASYTVVDGLTEVTLVTKDKFAVGTYYVAVLPQTFSGVTVTMFKADGSVASVTNTAGFRLDRSHRLETGVIDGGTFAGKITTITNAAELQGFLAAADSYSAEDVVTVANDIDLSGYELVPATSFAGTFDGQSNKITNWNTKTALFNAVSGTVKNLTIDQTCSLEVQIKGDAAFIALANSGTISGCTNYGTVTSVKGEFVPEEESVYVNRAIGTIAAVSTGSVISCENHGTVTITPTRVGKFTRQYIGGVTGIAQAASETANAMESCTNEGDVTFDGPFSSQIYLGGVCGGTTAGAGTFGDYGVFKTLKNNAAVNFNLTSSSSVATTYINIGGVIGYAEADLDDCDNAGTVTVTAPVNPSDAAHNIQRPAVAGVAGTVLYNMTGCDNSGEINVTGAFAAGTANTVGAGKRYLVGFGGVVAFVGSSATCSVTECNNSGKLVLELGMYKDTKSHAYVGGVAGYSDAAMTSCDNTAALDIKNTMRGGYIGGVAGELDAAMNACSNNAAISYDMVRTTAEGSRCTDLSLGGLVGYYNTSSDMIDSHNLAGGTISVSGGYVANPYYIGGLAGKTGVRLMGLKKDTYSKQYGCITVNSPGCVYVGGITGTTAKSLLDIQLSDVVITVNNPGTGSRIGGICGKKTATNDARLSAEVTVKVTCAEPTDNVYAGHVYGDLSGSFNLHTSVFNGSVTATNASGLGFAAGIVSAASGNLNLGTGDSALVQIRPKNTYGGTKITADNMNTLLYGAKSETSTYTFNTDYCKIQ